MNKQKNIHFLNDLSLWFLLFSNIITIFLAIKENWNLSTIMWIYWFQSVIIGFFNFIRMFQLKKFSTEGVKIDGQFVQPNNSTKFRLSFFFLFHYGFFHFGYLVFLLNYASLQIVGLKYILLTALIFFINHLFSYIYNKPYDTKKQNIGTLMFYPYARIIPMHLVIIFGSIFGGALTSFLILKTFADAIMHIIEHKVLRREKIISNL